MSTEISGNLMEAIIDNGARHDGTKHVAAASAAVTASAASAASETKAETTALAYRYAVTVTLTPEVYNYFVQQAAADERTLSKYMARELKQLFDQQINNPNPR
jgi:hypothetical protein